MFKTALLALGGNMQSDYGAVLDTQKAAIAGLQVDSIFPLKASEFYSTPCFPTGAGPDFVNSVVQIQTSLSAQALLAHLHDIEQEYGRVREKRWGMRTLDIDLIAYDDQVRPDIQTYTHWRDLSLADQVQQAPDQLILPHPRIQDRAFVLVPLMDVAPGWVHPVSGLTVAEMLEKLPKSDRKQVVPL